MLAAILAASNGEAAEAQAAARGPHAAAGRIDSDEHERVESGPPIAELFGALDISVAVPTAHLDQQYRLPGELTVMEAVRSGNPHLDPHRVHEVLAAMGLRAGRTDQICATLSGGERFRVALASGLLQDPAPQLLILDEPGNNLDLSSLEALVTALEGFGGAMVIVTHDDRLASELSVDTEWDVREFLRSESVDVIR